jgi:hypothetical protein
MLPGRHYYGMEHEPLKRVARLDRWEVAALPTQWTDEEKGQQLRLLLRERGIDPNRLYILTYHPRHHCWLFMQRCPESPVAAAVGKPDDVFYRQLAAELRRTARVASLSQGPWRVPYRLPDAPETLTPTELATELSAAGKLHSAVRFTREGGWHNGPSDN